MKVNIYSQTYPTTFKRQAFDILEKKYDAIPVKRRDLEEIISFVWFTLTQSSTKTSIAIIIIILCASKGSSKCFPNLQYKRLSTCLRFITAFWRRHFDTFSSCYSYNNINHHSYIPAFCRWRKLFMFCGFF